MSNTSTNWQFPYAKVIRFLWIGTAVMLLSFTIYLYLVSINWLNLFGGMPNLKTLENPKSEIASELYSADNVLLGKYFRENRTPIDFEELSPNLINALLATEDVRFEKHSGVDFKALIRVVFGVLTTSDMGGGSTITQQLAKNLFGTREEHSKGVLSKVPGLRTVIIKTKEWLLSIKLEKSYTKKEILAMYLNTVSFGSNALGIKVASQTFFNCNPNMLKPEQAAVLVGLLKAPTYYSPIVNPTNSLMRRNVVLTQMRRYNFLTKAEADSLKRLPIKLNYSVENHTVGMATYFRSAIRDFLLTWCKEHEVDLFSDGLKIYCTLDSRLQKYAEEAVEENMRLQQKNFDEQWKGRNPWVDEKQTEIAGYIEHTIKRTDEYKELAILFKNDSVSIWNALKKPQKNELVFVG